MGTQTQPVETLSQFIPRFNYWNKHISCWTRPFHRNVAYPLGASVLMDVGRGGNLFLHHFLVTSNHIANSSLRNACQGHTGMTFWATTRKLINDLQISAETAYLWHAVGVAPGIESKK